VVLVTGFPSAVFGTNCYVVAQGPGEECLVVDPGIGVLPQLAETLAEHRLRPAAVLLTHGHLDHTYSVTPVCGAHGVAAHVHADDRYRLRDPLTEFAPALLASLEQQFGSSATWSEPDEVVTLADETVLGIAGLDVRVVHAPGHTEGSVMFAFDAVPGGAPADVSTTVLTGDVLFAGSIGRTDLVGGDDAAMLRSLRERVLPLPDETWLLPGHGPHTTMARERATNPFLRELHTAGTASS
jgi:glyoxylase-like metal-dependent hydrolase (beta-lactamase superfamily II)